MQLVDKRAVALDAAEPVIELPPARIEVGERQEVGGRRPSDLRRAEQLAESIV